VRALPQKKHRAETGLFLAEGLRILSEAVDKGQCDARPGHPAGDAAARRGRAPRRGLPGQRRPSAGDDLRAGRLAFWLGYLAGTFARAPGMAATMVVNLATILLAVGAGLVG